MSFHHQGSDLVSYRKSATSFLEEWSYRHLDWRIHKFSRVCPICLSIKLNRELLDDLYSTKSHSLDINDDDTQGEPAEFEEAT